MINVEALTCSNCGAPIIAVAPEAAKDKTLTQLREQLADALLGYMKITTAKEWDFMGDSTVFRGEVIVLDPCLE